MNYKKIINDSFSALTPLTANEEIIRNVTERAEKKSMKKTFKLRKPVIALCAVTAAAAAVTVTGYASGWNYSAVFNQIFGEKSANIESLIVPEATEICDDIEHLDFEIVAAAADRQSAIIIIDVTPQNGLPEELPANILKDLEFGIYSEDPDAKAESVSSAGGWSTSVIEETEEKVRVAILAKPKKSISGQKITVYAHGSRLHNIITETDNLGYLTGREEYWRAEFIADFIENEIVYSKDILFESENGGSFHIEEIIVTPISVYLSGESEGDYFSPTEGINTYAVINNGENTEEKEISKENRLIFIMSTWNELTENADGKDLISMSFKEPINPEEITAIVIGGTTIELR